MYNLLYMDEMQKWVCTFGRNAPLIELFLEQLDCSIC